MPEILALAGTRCHPTAGSVPGMRGGSRSNAPAIRKHAASNTLSSPANSRQKSEAVGAGAPHPSRLRVLLHRSPPARQLGPPAKHGGPAKVLGQDLCRRSKKSKGGNINGGMAAEWEGCHPLGMDANQGRGRCTQAQYSCSAPRHPMPPAAVVSSLQDMRRQGAAPAHL